MNDNNLVFSKVYMWMFIGLLTTFVTGYSLSLNLELVYNLIMGIGILPIILIQLGIAIFFSVRITKMSSITAKICFLLYSFITGLTFSVLFLIYEMGSIIMVFGITSFLFLLFAAYGYFTKKDITKLGPMLFMVLIGAIIVSIVNIFILRNSGVDLFLSILFILIFLGFIIYDIQKIKTWVLTMGEEKGAVFGAFQLYLDFINLFIRLLRIIGKQK